MGLGRRFRPCVDEGAELGVSIVSCNVYMNKYLRSCLVITDSKYYPLVSERRM